MAMYTRLARPSALVEAPGEGLSHAAAALEQASYQRRMGRHAPASEPMSSPSPSDKLLNPVPSTPVCPRCKRSAYRVHRRLRDHLINLFISIGRFRCSAFGCDWEGNLRKNPTSSDVWDH